MTKVIDLFERLNEKAQFIVSLSVADVVEDADLLVTALCAGDLGEVMRTLHETLPGESKNMAANKACEIRRNSALMSSVASKGFFTTGLLGLLDLAKKKPNTGSRLMPIFHEMTSNSKKYGIPNKLRVRVINYMSDKKECDGFAITAINRIAGSAIVHAADWVTEELF